MAVAIGMMIGGAVLNAAAFTGGNILSSSFDANGAKAEAARHNEATENYQRATAEWSQKRQVRLDFLNEQLRREVHADKVYSDVDEAMRLYYEVSGGDEAKQKNIPDLGDKPTLSDYYQRTKKL